MSHSLPPAEAGTFALLARLFREHGRRHVLAYLLAAGFLAVGAAATSMSAWLLKPILNHMVDGDGFKELRFLAWAVAGLFSLRGLATFGSYVLLSRTGNRIVAEIQNRLFA